MEQIPPVEKFINVNIHFSYKPGIIPYQQVNVLTEKNQHWIKVAQTASHSISKLKCSLSAHEVNYLDTLQAIIEMHSKQPHLRQPQ